MEGDGGGSVGGGKYEAVEIGGEGEISIGVPGGGVGGGDEGVHPVVGVEIGEAEGGGGGLGVREVEWGIGLEWVGEVGGMERVADVGCVVPWNWMQRERVEMVLVVVVVVWVVLVVVFLLLFLLLLLLLLLLLDNLLRNGHEVPTVCTHVSHSLFSANHITPFHSPNTQREREREK